MLRWCYLDTVKQVTVNAVTDVTAAAYESRGLWFRPADKCRLYCYPGGREGRLCDSCRQPGGRAHVWKTAISFPVYLPGRNALITSATADCSRQVPLKTTLTPANRWHWRQAPDARLHRMARNQEAQAAQYREAASGHLFMSCAVVMSIGNQNFGYPIKNRNRLGFWFFS